MAKQVTLKVKRGPKATMLSQTFAPFEALWTTDEQVFYIANASGVPVPVGTKYSFTGGYLAITTATGITESAVSITDLENIVSNFEDKMDKVPTASEYNIAVFDDEGQVQDGGKALAGIASDISSAISTHNSSNTAHSDIRGDISSLATTVAGKQNQLTSGQLDVVNANPFTNTLKNKLEGIEEGAEVNVINEVQVNGVALTPDVDGAVDVIVPTKSSDLTNDAFVESVTAGTSNVVVDNTDPLNPVISVQALEFPNQFVSTETPTGSVGTPLNGMDLTVLTPIISGKVLAENDTVIFANGIQAIVVSINTGADEYDAVVSVVPIATSFAAITGQPTDNTNLANALSAKQDSLTTAQLAAVDSGITAAKVSKLDGIESGAQVNVVESATLNGTAVVITGKNLDIEIDAVSSEDFQTALDEKMDLVPSANENNLASFDDAGQAVDSGIVKSSVLVEYDILDGGTWV